MSAGVADASMRLQRNVSITGLDYADYDHSSRSHVTGSLSVTSISNVFKFCEGLVLVVAQNAGTVERERTSLTAHIIGSGQR